MAAVRMHQTLFVSIIVTLLTVPTSRAFTKPGGLTSRGPHLSNFQQIASRLARAKSGNAALPYSPLLRQDEDFFSLSYINPSEPADSIPSTNRLLAELRSWSELSLFVNVFLALGIDQQLGFNDGAYVILAPVQGAFLELLLTIRPSEEFFLSQPEEIANNLERLLGSSLLQDIIRHHIIPGNIAEQELAAQGAVSTLLGTKIDFTNFPDLPNENEPTGISTRPARRLYRSIEPKFGRVMMINKVLQPFNLSAILEGSGLEVSQPGNTTISPINIGPINIDPAAILENDLLSIRPWRGFRNFVLGRTDTQIVAAVYTIYARRVELSIRPAGQLHFFLPTDTAFIELARQMFGDQLDIDENDPVPGILDTAVDVLNVINGIDGIPSLVDILFYHIVETNARYEALIGEGALTTFYPNATLSVTEDGVVDNDPSRPDAKRIASFPTFQGWVTVIDSVLLPLDAAVAKAVITANVEAGPSPSPSICPEDDGVCFAGDATVTLSNGRRVRMTELQAGDEVHIDTAGAASKIFLFTHRSPTLARFVDLETENGRSIRLTKGHYIYANARVVTAGSVKVGDVLETESGSEKVTRVGSVVRRGLFAPHSVHGDLMVDGVRVSGYTNAVAPRLAHALLAPVRAAVIWGGIKEPLGSLLYEGVAEPWLRSFAWLFGGLDRY